LARYILRRFIWAIPIVLFVTFLAFVALRIGTDPVQQYLRQNPRASAAKVAQYKSVNGLNGTIPEQYVRWLKHFVTGNWGRSIKGSRPVWPELKRAFGNTLVLGSLATVVGISVGIAIGVVAALKQYSKFDSVTSVGAFVGLSIPPFISAIVLQLIFAVYMTKWLGLSKPFLPTSGVYPAGHKGFDLWLRLKHLILPTIVVVIQIIAVYSRYMRAT
jgi:peptide/nickel transport system permease protein